MMAKLERTQSNTQQNIEQLQNPTMGATISNKSTTSLLYLSLIVYLDVVYRLRCSVGTILNWYRHVIKTYMASMRAEYFLYFNNSRI